MVHKTGSIPIFGWGLNMAERLDPRRGQGCKEQLSRQSPVKELRSNLLYLVNSIGRIGSICPNTDRLSCLLEQFLR